MLKTLLTPLALAAATLGSADAAIISLETDATRLVAGETFDVALTFEAESEDEILTFYDILLFQEGAEVVLSSVSFVDPATGVNQLDLPGGPFVGDFSFTGDFDIAQVFGVTTNEDATLLADQADAFTVAVLTFDTVATGIATIGLDTVFTALFGADFEMLNLTLDDATVAVEVVPLPAAALFMLTGLAGVAARRRLG